MSAKEEKRKPKRSVTARKGVARKKVAAKKKAVAKKKVAGKVAASPGSRTARKKASAPRAPKSASRKGAVDEKTLNAVDSRTRYEMIAKMAYFRAEKRGFESGWELEDWFESELMVDRMLGRRKE